MRLIKLFQLLLLLNFSFLSFFAQSGASTPKLESSSVEKKDGKVVINFKVSQKTDVAIFIEDSSGKVVRHLAAGVLGENAPEPFAKNSLDQKIIWDNKADYGKDAGAGPFKVRIALGMDAQFEKIISDGAPNIGGVRAMATAPDGTLVVSSAFGADVANWSGWNIQSYNQKGEYQKTVFPPPNYFSEKELDELGVANVSVDGKDVPIYAGIMTRSYLPEVPQRRAAMTITSKNEILMVMNNGSISAIHLNSKAAMGGMRGKRIFNTNQESQITPFIALSSDEKYVFVTGCPLEGRKGGFAVYKVNLPERNKVEVFFGEDTVKGSDQKHLGGYGKGVAVDGKGNLLVADVGNNRVLILSEKTGEYLSEIPFKNPNAIVINKKNSNVYVSSNINGDIELIKLNNITEKTELKKLKIPRNGAHDYPYVLAIDTNGENPVIWAGGDYGALIRLEDVGDKFTQKEMEKIKVGHGAFVGMTVDRFSPDKEVYARIDSGVFMRYNEATGKTDMVKTGNAMNEGVTIEVGPSGELFGAGYPYNIFKFDRTGKPSPWKSTNRFPPPFTNKDGKQVEYKGPAHAIYAPVSMVFMTHTLGVRHDGQIFIFQPKSPGDRPPKMLMEYTPDGDMIKKDPIIWKVSDVAVGPKFDAQGNIYIAEQIKPADQFAPEEFKEFLGEVVYDKQNESYFNNPKGTVLGMYGSIVKFSPKGGMIHWGGQNPFDGEPKLDESLKVKEASYYSEHNVQRLSHIKTTGAEWIKLGISHIELHYCNCESTRFDVDPFGRVYFPDLLRYQVRVIDTNANDIMHFGGYGNADSKGKNSIVVDDVTGKVVAGKKEDNPYDKTAIPFNWLIGVGATDKYIYAGDSSNKRLTQVKILYKSETVIEIK